jgi:type I restriction enzyme R subunit
LDKQIHEELDITAYEADMRHLLNSYVQADPAMELGELGTRLLLELIVDTGSNDVVARQIDAKGKLSNRAVAETIINNVRQGHHSGPTHRSAFLRADVVATGRSDPAESGTTPKRTRSFCVRPRRWRSDGALQQPAFPPPASTFRYPTPEEALAEFARRLDRTVRERAPAGWKGDPTRETQVLNALFTLLDRDREETRALFEIVKHR